METGSESALQRAPLASEAARWTQLHHCPATCIQRCAAMLHPCTAFGITAQVLCTWLIFPKVTPQGTMSSGSGRCERLHTSMMPWRPASDTQWL